MQVRSELPEHDFAFGVQTWALQLSEAVSQYWLEVQTVAVWPEPLALQVRSELPEHDFAFGVQD